MNQREQQVFDEMVEGVLERLPVALRRLIDEVPVIVLDEPTREMLDDMGILPEEAGELCGLHTGVAFTERTVERSGEMPADIHIFRRGVVEEAGGWEDLEAVREEIEVTLLHEIGHHFGLDEDDLERLGYG